MEEHPLLRAVANWPGRGPTQLAFEALGFSIHRARQNRIIQFCGDQQSDLLNRYWDEVAMETMQSLGQGDPDERAFAIRPAYRSAFLDELFAARDFVELPFRYPPLVKCMFEYIKRIYLDREFRERERGSVLQELTEIGERTLGHPDNRMVRQEARRRSICGAVLRSAGFRTSSQSLA